MKTKKLINTGLLLMLLLGTTTTFSQPAPASAPAPYFYDDTDDVNPEAVAYPIDRGLIYLAIGGILLIGFLMHKKVIVKN
jgi:hypothetical protein